MKLHSKKPIKSSEMKKKVIEEETEARILAGSNQKRYTELSTTCPMRNMWLKINDIE